MQFSRIVGKIDSKIIQEAQTKLTKVFLEFGTKIDNDSVGTFLGGDPLIFTLLVPVEHVATLNIPTAATDGKRFYWNPKWIVSKNLVGVRLGCYHESGHALFMHPQRRGNRIPRLWNIAVDYIVNGMIMDDLKIRCKNSATQVHNIFTSGLGNYLTLPQCIEMFKNPFAPIKGMEKFIPEPEDPHEVKAVLPHPNDDRELTENEKKEVEKRTVQYKFYYADPNLPNDMKKPEKIYDLLFQFLPKCPECGRVGVYNMPSFSQQSGGSGGSGKKSQPGAGGQNNQKDQNNVQKKQNKQHCDHDHHDNHNTASGDNGNNDSQGNTNQSGKSDSQQSGPSTKFCGQCGGGFDILDYGSTVDEHIDATEEPEKLAKRISDAIKTAKQLAGRVPSALEDELGALTAARIKWQDFIRAKLVKTRAGNSKNDWTKFRSRPMFAGLMIPKRINAVAKFGCLLDTSASMSRNDMSFGVSQLQVLDERSEGVIVPADAQIYWDKATKVRAAKPDELSRIKLIGRGGTKYAEFFANYKKHIGPVDFLIIITDGFLLADDVKEMMDPGVDVIWLITSGSAFKAPFGRVFDLKAI